MNLASLNHAELQQAREQLDARQRDLETAAIGTLRHRPLRFALRLLFSAFAARAASPMPTEDEVQTA